MCCALLELVNSGTSSKNIPFISGYKLNHLNNSVLTFATVLSASDVAR